MVGGEEAVTEGFNFPKAPMVPVSWGELIDKITILEIKSTILQDRAAVGNVANELSYLSLAFEAVSSYSEVQLLKSRLASINRSLWDVEDEIRMCESQSDFGENFTKLARSVYMLNDERAGVKREINLFLGSELLEEKCYGQR